MCVFKTSYHLGVPRAIIWAHPVDDPHGGHLLTVPAVVSTKLAPCPMEETHRKTMGKPWENHRFNGF